VKWTLTVSHKRQNRRRSQREKSDKSTVKYYIDELIGLIEIGSSVSASTSYEW